MVISDEKKISDIQREFHEKFPFLKLEFYSEHHEEGAGSPRSKRIPPATTIGDARTIHTEGNLNIADDQKVSELENSFYEKYGLSVQVFRKSGELWLQTITTDDWSLGQQNKRGGAQPIDLDIDQESK